MAEDTPPPIATRVTVGLIPQAAEDLAALRARSGLSRTDIVNRAISLYQFVEAEIAAGRRLAVYDPDTDGTQLVKLL